MLNRRGGILTNQTDDKKADEQAEEEKTPEELAHEAYLRAYKERQRRELLKVPPPQDLIAKTVYL